MTYAIVVGRCATQREADRLADRFAARHDRTYTAELRPRGDFDRRPYAVTLFTPDVAVVQASLESYKVDHGVWKRLSPDPSRCQGCGWSIDCIAKTSGCRLGKKCQCGELAAGE